MPDDAGLGYKKPGNFDATGLIFSLTLLEQKSRNLLLLSFRFFRGTRGFAFS